MQRSRLFVLVIILLLLSNLALLVYTTVGRGEAAARPRHPHPDGPRNLIIERLQFSSAQVAQYDKLIQWHRHEIGEAERRIMALKNSLYATLSAPTNQRYNDSLVASLATEQKQIEYIHYKHFQDIRAMCTGTQKPLFDELSHDIAELFNHRPPHKPPHP